MESPSEGSTGRTKIVNDLRQISLRSLGPIGQVGLLGGGKLGPVRAFVHTGQDSGKLALVKSDPSDLHVYQAADESGHNVTLMDIYDTRRANLAVLIQRLEVSYAAFGKMVGYNGAYIGQLINRTKRSKGGDAIVSDKVVGKILARLKEQARYREKKIEVDRAWFDHDSGFAEPIVSTLNRRRTAEEPLRVVEAVVADTPPSLLVDDEKFPDHLNSTWPYMTPQQREAIRYLEASFRKPSGAGRSK